MLLHLSSAENARSVEEDEKILTMRRLSEKLTGYVINAGAISEELYAVYQYGFQIGLEMFCCFGVCLTIAIYLHMIPEFIVSAGIFMLLRTYAGGVHLNSFQACFICSVTVQTFILYISGRYQLSIVNAWIMILVGGILIGVMAPVDNVNRELDGNEKLHCKKKTITILMSVLIFTIFCTFAGAEKIVSLAALTVLVIAISQCIGILKCKNEKRKNKQG